MSDTNGIGERPEHADEPLSMLDGLSETQMTAIRLQMDGVLREMRARLTDAVARAGQMAKAFLGLLGVWSLTVGVGLWFFANSREVDVVVQTVVHDKDGQFVSLGVPEKLLAYQPKDGAFLAMIRTWVQNYRWRTDEQERLLTQEAWRWLYGHTCGGAAEKLEAYEKEEKPTIRTDIVRSVKLQPITQTPTTFVAVWEETTVDKSKGLKTTAWQVGTFTVGRTQPTTRKDADLNPLGLCVTSYHIKDGTNIR